MLNLLNKINLRPIENQIGDMPLKKWMLPKKPLIFRGFFCLIQSSDQHIDQQYDYTMVVGNGLGCNLICSIKKAKKFGGIYINAYPRY